MARKLNGIELTRYDDLFKTDAERETDHQERVQIVPAEQVFPYARQPYSVDRPSADLVRLMDSIERTGIAEPLIVRPRSEGGYEIISGHRRQYAAKKAGLDTVPVIVRNMTDDDAIILLVDSNIQRENILPSERAFAFKMKMDAIKRQGARSDLTSAQVAPKLSSEKIGEDSGMSKDTVKRYIRLTNLIPKLLELVDDKKISFTPAVELSYLDAKQQCDFMEVMDTTQNAPSLSQAQRIKKLAQQGKFSYDAVYDIMNEVKKSELDTVTIKNETLRKYFPRSYTPRQMEEKIIQLLEAWQQQRQQAKLKKRKQEAER